MASLDFKAFDADNHYYEAEDAFIRHVDPKMHKRCMQWAEINGRGVQQVDSRRLGFSYKNCIFAARRLRLTAGVPWAA